EGLVELSRAGQRPAEPVRRGGHQHGPNLDAGRGTGHRILTAEFRGALAPRPLATAPCPLALPVTFRRSPAAEPRPPPPPAPGARMQLVPLDWIIVLVSIAVSFLPAIL